MEISAERLYKKFRDHWIIRDFSHRFHKDVRYGIAGPNGTGKTTLLHILAGLIPPSKGRLEYREGGEVLSDELWYRQMAFAAPYADLYDYMDLKELLRHHLAFKTLAGGLTAEDFIERCYLKGHESKLIRSYSSGMKQRLKLGLALLSESPVLFLDEPQSNLDDRAKFWYQDLLRERAPGRIVLIASNEADDFKMTDEVITLAAPVR